GKQFPLRRGEYHSTAFMGHRRKLHRTLLYKLTHILALEQGVSCLVWVCVCVCKRERAFIRFGLHQIITSPFDRMKDSLLSIIYLSSETKFNMELQKLE